jgi:flagellar biosynthesis protein
MDDKRIKKAAALKYTADSDQAPKVVAKGRGLIADKIIELGRRNQVPVVADPNLVHMLDALEIDTRIPPEMYQVVAEVLVFVYQINRKQEKS